MTVYIPVWVAWVLTGLLVLDIASRVAQVVTKRTLATLQEQLRVERAALRRPATEETKRP